MPHQCSLTHKGLGQPSTSISRPQKAQPEDIGKQGNQSKLKLVPRVLGRITSGLLAKGNKATEVTDGMGTRNAKEATTLSPRTQKPAADMNTDTHICPTVQLQETSPVTPRVSDACPVPRQEGDRPTMHTLRDQKQGLDQPNPIGSDNLCLLHISTLATPTLAVTAETSNSEQAQQLGPHLQIHGGNRSLIEPDIIGTTLQAKLA